MKKFFLAICSAVFLFTACNSYDDSGVAGVEIDYRDSIDTAYTYELPVIFHVLYSDASNVNQYIPYQRLGNILSYVNQIYQGGVYGPSENVHVRFVLATTDEDGKTLRYPGVEYVHYTDEYPIDPIKFMNDDTGKNVKYIWEPNKYINVMMYNFKSTSDNETILGISHMPYMVQGHEKVEGLSTLNRANVTKRALNFAYCSSINSLYAYQQPNGSYYQSDRYTNADHQPTIISSNDIVVTLAHELGHYLGLYHAFTEARGKADADQVDPVDSCGDTDYCADTYSYNRYDYMNYLKLMAGVTRANALLIRRSCEGVNYDADNIMDYSWTLGFRITKDQKERIRNVLRYSPLIPGPKLRDDSPNKAKTRAEDDEPIHWKITTIQ